MTRFRPLRAALAFSLVLGAVAVAPSVLAQSDPARDARLLTVDGKFREAEELLAKAPPEVQNDPELRRQLAENALKYVKNKTGEDRRSGLSAVRGHYERILTVAPADAAAGAGAIAIAVELAELDVAAKKADAARAQADWAVGVGEKALSNPEVAPEVRASLGKAFGMRASLAKSVDKLDAIVKDYQRGAQLLAEAANASPEQASAWLDAAATLRFREAKFIHDSIPLEEEKRDDEALVAAIALATQAASAPGATEAAHTTHLQTLIAAHQWKVSGDHGKPFMQALTPPYEGLALQVPKATGWKRGTHEEWEVYFDRKLEENPGGAMQILLMGRQENAGVLGKTWKKYAEIVPIRFEGMKENYSTIASEVAPIELGDKKKGPHVWHFQISGLLANGGRQQRVAEWIWPSTTRKGVVWNLRILDWRRPSDVEEPDVAAFVASAIGEGLWPAGATKAEDEGDKGKKKKRPPKKKP